MEFLLLTLLLTLLTNATPIPVLKVQGTHYEVGVQIVSLFQQKGQRFKQQIQDYFSLYTNLRKVFVPWYHTAKGKKTFDDYLSVVARTYPQYLEEMAGLALGANVSVEEVQLVNFRAELETLLLEADSGPEACTDVLLNDLDTASIGVGHNEDNIPVINHRAYMVDVHITCSSLSQPRSHCKEELFVAYAYPGELPGTAYGFNCNGITVSLNALFPKTVLTARTGRQILSRALLGAKSVEEIQDILEDKGHGSATGFSVNIGVVGQGKAHPQLYNIEVAPNTRQPKSEVNTYQVWPAQVQNSTGTYYHVNIYRRIRTAELPDKINSSIHRSRRIKEFPVTKSFQDMRTILGDTKDPDFPIFRRTTSSDPGMTLCTAIYNLGNCTLDIYDTNPKEKLASPVNSFHLPACDEI